jgi:hypothetical protein
VDPFGTDGGVPSSGQKRAVNDRKRTFFRPFAEAVFQSKPPSYSQGVGSYNCDKPVPKRKKAGESSSRQNGKAQCPTARRKQKQQTTSNTMTVQVVPKDETGFIALCAQCAGAVTAYAAILHIEQNDPVAFTTDYYDYVGLPGTDPATAGKRGQLNQKRLALLAAQAIRRNAIQAGRDFNARAIDHLKGYLGRSWNTHWVAAGFSEGTLRQPRNPVSLLLELRAYLAMNTAHELPANGVTATQANALELAITAAVLAEGDATTARDVATKARDESFKRLRDRIVGLRNELDQLLESDDMRWRTFGFARPIDRRIPKVVTGLTVRPGAVAGEIIVQWDPAIGAENYRVLRQVQTVDVEPVEVGLFSDRTVIISGLPSGKTVIVSVTARNPAGETLPVNSTIVVA